MELTKLPQDEFDLFRRIKRDSGIKVYVHAPYVLHAFAKPENVSKNNGFLKRMVQTAVDLEIDGFVLHMGGTKWYDDPIMPGWTNEVCVGVAKKLLTDIYPTGHEWCPILFENCANGNGMSGDLRIITDLITVLKSDGHNVGLCLDTLHAWAWGYDYTSTVGFAEVIGEHVYRHLHLIHLNSGPEKSTCGSKYDRHEAIHKGCIPQDCFQSLLRTLPGKPVIIEGHDHSDILSDMAFVKAVDAEPREMASSLPSYQTIN